MTEDEMVGWYHRLNGHEFGWTLGAGDGQGGLACCSSWGCKELDTTEQLNSENLRYPLQFGGTPGIVVYLVAQKFKDKSCGWS